MAGYPANNFAGYRISGWSKGYWKDSEKSSFEVRIIIPRIYPDIKKGRIFDATLIVYVIKDIYRPREDRRDDRGGGSSYRRDDRRGGNDRDSDRRGGYGRDDGGYGRRDDRGYDRYQGTATFVA